MYRSAGAAPALDSEEFRRRLATYIRYTFGATEGFDGVNLGRYLQRESGLACLQYVNGWYWEKAFLEAPLPRMLNLITLVWRYCSTTYSEKKRVPGSGGYGPGLYAPMWSAFVSRALAEEHLGYTLTDQCAVRYKVDEEFERHRTTIIGNLGADRYAGVLHAFNDAHDKMTSVPPELKAAVRLAFESVEILFKLMFGVDRISRSAIDAKLKPAIATLYASDVTAQRAYEKIAASLANWVDGLHFYRHGQGQSEPVDPPIEFATFGSQFDCVLAQIFARARSPVWARLAFSFISPPCSRA